jgi:hypothetical protein
VKEILEKIKDETCYMAIYTSVQTIKRKTGFWVEEDEKKQKIVYRKARNTAAEI